jgi:magnesium transporter
LEVLTTLDRDRIAALRGPDGEFFWLDLLSPSADDLEELGRLFGLHPAAVEDSREWHQLPKVDDYTRHVLFVVYTAERADGHTRPIEVHLHVSGDWVITVRRCATPLDRLRRTMPDQPVDDEDLVLYKLLDALADGWDPVIDELDRRVDEVEAQVLERPRQEHLPMIYRLKQEVAEGLRQAMRQAHVLPEAVELIHNLPGLARGSREWLQDLTAHADSIASDLRRLTGDLSALTDTFFNANANRLNRLATLVAVGSLFFLIWTLVTGFFGQNFGFLIRHIDSERAFWYYEIGALVVPTVVLAVVLWWRRRDWWG